MMKISDTLLDIFKNPTEENIKLIKDELNRLYAIEEKYNMMLCHNDDYFDEGTWYGD